MRSVIFLAALISFGSSLEASAPPDDDTVRATIANYVSARNANVPDQVRNLFTADADQLVSTGEWRRGADELTRGMAASSGKEQAKSSVAITDVRMIDPDVAIVDGRYQTTSLDGTVRDMWTTFVLKRTKEGWRIAAIRNMKPAANQSK